MTSSQQIPYHGGIALSPASHTPISYQPVAACEIVCRNAIQRARRENRQLFPARLAPGRLRSPSNNCPTICAIQQEREGDVYKLHGAAEIYYETYVLKADEATFNADTSEATASGHFSLDGGPNDDHIRASHGTYNLDLPRRESSTT